MMIPNTALWYLFPDTVPQKYIGTFMAFFNVVSQGAGFLFNRYFLGYADGNMGWLYTGMAILYAVLMIVMCFGVKEGEYPPPATGSSVGFSLNVVKEYVRDCYSIPFYY